MDRLRLMETFVAVAKQGSYTRAAKDLALTRAMVSKRVSDLEAALGVRLLNRNAHRVGTTAAGEDYLKDCIALLDQVSLIEDRLIGKHSAPQGDLKILASKTLGDILLAPIVADFCRDYPAISLRLLLRDMPTHGVDLVSEGFDLAVRTMPSGDSSLIARPIARLRRVLVAAPDYIARSGAVTCPRDLLTRNCLNPNDSRRAAWRFAGPGGAEVLTVSGTPQVNSTSVVRQAVLKGLGIALLSEFAVAGDLERGALIRVLPERALDGRILYAVFQPDRHRPFRIKVFVDYLSKRMSALSYAEPIAPLRSRQKT